MPPVNVLVIPAVPPDRFKLPDIVIPELPAQVTFVASAGSGPSIIKSLQESPAATFTVYAAFATEELVSKIQLSAEVGAEGVVVAPPEEVDQWLLSFVEPVPPTQ
jgi:hypothetical protein